MKKIVFAYPDGISFGLLAGTLLAGRLLHVVPWPNSVLLLSLIVLLIIVSRLGLPSWVCGLIVALPVTAMLVTNETLKYDNMIISWTAISMIMAVIVLFLCHKRIDDLWRPFLLIFSGSVPVIICGLAILLSVTLYYDFRMEQLTETILPILQGATILFATALVCHSGKVSMLMWLVLSLTAVAF